MQLIFAPRFLSMEWLTSLLLLEGSFRVAYAQGNPWPHCWRVCGDRRARTALEVLGVSLDPDQTRGQVPPASLRKGRSHKVLVFQNGQRWQMDYDGTLCACCKGQCIDTTFDRSNCGDCGHNCPAGECCCNGQRCDKLFYTCCQHEVRSLLFSNQVP